MSTIYGPHMRAAGDAFFSAWDWFSSAGILAYPSPSYAASNWLMTGLLNLSAADYAKLQILASFWLAGMISFYVLRAMVGSDKAAFLGSLVYLGSGAFVNQIVEGHLGFVTAYPFLILIFYLFHDAYVNGMSKKTVALPAFLLLYGGFVAPHMVLLAAAMMLTFMAADLAGALITHKRERTLYKLVLTLFLAAVLVLPVAYAMFFLGGPTVYETSYSLEEASIGSSNFLAALVLGGGEVTNTEGYFGIVPGQLLMWASQLLALPLFFFALLSLFVERCRRLTVPLFLVIAFNMFMAMGPDSPLGFLFTFMFDHLPLVDSFRALSRFTMLNAVFYAILIAITVAHWPEVSVKANRLNSALMGLISKGKRKAVGPSRELSAALAALLVIASLSGLIVLANGDVVRAFDMPREYTEPFEYINASDDGEYYKIYTLPMVRDTYQHTSFPSVSGYGYPQGTTLDPGTFLPAVINERGISHTLYAPDYWSGMYALMADRTFGYQNTLALLGGSAAVKYVVDQWYAPEKDKTFFADMSGGSVLTTYPSGAKVIQIDSYSDPLKAQNGLIVGSGGLENMYLLLGAGVFDPYESSYASLQWLEEDQLASVLGASDLIVIQNGDLVELAYELGYLEDALLNLSNQVNRHREDLTSRWVQVADSGAGEMSVTTLGENELTVKVDKDVGDGSSVLIRAQFGPEQGTLGITFNGRMTEYINLRAPISGTEWVSVEVPDGIERIDSLTFTGSQDYAVELYDAVVLTAAEEEALTSQVRDALFPYSSKVGYSYTALNIYLQNSLSAQLGNWTLGNGVMSSESIGMSLNTVFDNDLTLSVYAPDWGARDITLDSNSVSGEGISSGAYRYELGTLAAGEHDVQVFGDGLYGMTLLPQYELGAAAPSISFERISPTEWRVSVTNASGPFILKFSEGMSEFWELQADGATTTWFRSDYLANAFIVNGSGDLEMTLVFSKQAAYESFLYLYAFALVASTGLIAAAYMYARIGAQEKKNAPLNAKRD